MKTTIIVFCVMALISCKPKLSERNREIIEILKQDIELKILNSTIISEVFTRNIEDLAKSQRTKPWFELQHNLLAYYHLLNINSSNSLAIDSLNIKINAWNKVIHNHSNPDIQKLLISKLNYVQIHDSLDFLLFQNKFLSKIIDLQQNAVLNIDANGLCHWGETECYNLICYDLLNKDYKENDTLSTYIIPFKGNKELRLNIKLFKDNKLIYQATQGGFLFNYKPLKKGKYRIEINVIKLRSNNLLDVIPCAFNQYEFEVK